MSIEQFLNLFDKKLNKTQETVLRALDARMENCVIHAVDVNILPSGAVRNSAEVRFSDHGIDCSVSLVF
jgi:hypothetical protein